MGILKTCKNFWEQTKETTGKEKVENLINKMLWTSNDNAKILYGKGMTLKSKGQKEESLEVFKSALKEDSSFLAVKYEIGMYYYNEGDINYSAQYFREITEKIPFHTAPNLLMAQIYPKLPGYPNFPASCVSQH